MAEVPVPLTAEERATGGVFYALAERLGDHGEASRLLTEFDRDIAAAEGTAGTVLCDTDVVLTLLDITGRLLAQVDSLERREVGRDYGIGYARLALALGNPGEADDILTAVLEGAWDDHTEDDE